MSEKCRKKYSIQENNQKDTVTCVHLYRESHIHNTFQVTAYTDGVYYFTLTFLQFPVR